MERSLALMCGAGVLPARAAAEARRQGWRVVAFTFGDAPAVGAHADLAVPSRVTDIGPVLETLQRERVSAALFAGTFWLGDVVRATAGDTASRSIVGAAGSMVDARLTDAVVTTLGALGIEVLDQRAFVGDWIGGRGCWSARQPTETEWSDVARGLALARACAEARIGQTVVLKRGAVAAVEALEGTSAAIRRGAALAGAGAVVVKAVAPANDYRFDVPAIGPETIEAAVSGRVAVVAVEADRVLLVERETVLRLADAAGIAVVGIDGGEPVAASLASARASG